MSERTQKPPTPAPPWEPKQGDGDGPRSPDVSKPETKDLLKRMRKIDPNQSRRSRFQAPEFPIPPDAESAGGRTAKPALIQALTISHAGLSDYWRLLLFSRVLTHLSEEGCALS